jgi:hypothetical protein
MNQVLVFKTNLLNEQHVQQASKHLNKVKGIVQWNVDLQDCDNVLRVVATPLCTIESVQNILANAGYWCCELND